MLNCERQIWIDGGLVAWDDAQVHLLSQSMQRGTLIFDFMRVTHPPRGAAVFRLSDHMHRFLASCALMDLPVGLDHQALVDTVSQVVALNPDADFAKTCAYLAYNEAEGTPPGRPVSLAVSAYKIPGLELANEQGPDFVPASLKIKIETERRNRRPDIIPPQAKVAANYASPLLAQWHAKQEGYDEVILLDEFDQVTEAPTSNFFIVDESSAILTAPDDIILHGITRQATLDLAAAEGIAVTQVPFTREKVLSAREAFVSNTRVGIVPVQSVDKQTIRNGEIGEVTHRLLRRYNAILNGEDPLSTEWLHFV